MRPAALLRRLRRARAGSAAVEFALIAPLLILMTGGIVEIGRIFQVYDSANRLATQFASAWSDCSDFPSGTCLTEAANYDNTYAIQNIAPQLSAPGVTVRMFEVTMSGTSPTVVYAYPAGTAMSAGQTAAAQGAFSSGQTGVVVTVSYTHSLQFFSNVTGISNALGSLLNVSYTVAQLKS